ncbi:alpha/beta fold hydrolase [Paenibacillus sp. YYML68]|uniref:alpha/beta fold hydrolase n=1 Tax=Paenibacillus sp. YYML68 TaxID=2909250 RepID=UPI0024903307|nr:alpha/beta hydrolase [Paenibacillus sp. YYML68]
MAFMTINGTRIYYRMRGQGIPLVLIHPPLLTSSVFDRQLEELSDMFQVITFDARGHGRSDYSRIPISYGLLAEDIVQLLDVLQIKKAYIGGYSTGGSVALEALLTASDRFWGGILISAMSEVSTPVLSGEVWLARLLSGMRAKRLLASAISYGNADSFSQYRLLYESAMRGDIRNIHQYYRFSYLYNCSDRLHEIQLPTLLIYGDKDKRFTGYAQLLHRGLASSSLVMVKGAKHQLPTKEARRLHFAVREWVKEHQAELEPVTRERLLQVVKQGAVPMEPWVYDAGEDIHYI